MLPSAPPLSLTPPGCLPHLYRLPERRWRAAGCQRGAWTAGALFRGVWGHNWLCWRQTGNQSGTGRSL